MVDFVLTASCCSAATGPIFRFGKAAMQNCGSVFTIHAARADDSAIAACAEFSLQGSNACRPAYPGTPQVALPYLFGGTAECPAVRRSVERLEGGAAAEQRLAAERFLDAVSYTHLTLPTNREV